MRGHKGRWPQLDKVCAVQVLVLSACVAMSMYIGISVVKMFGSNHPESDNTVTPLFSLSFNHSHRVLFVHTYVRTYVRMRVSVFVDVSKGGRV